MQATKANLKRCGTMSVMFCTMCNKQYSTDDGDYWDYADDFVFECRECGSGMVLGHFAQVFIPASPRVIAVIHDQEDWISTWLVEAEPDADPLKAIEEELFPDDEDWPALKDSIEWFYLEPLTAMTLKDMVWPETCSDAQTFEHNTVKAAIYRAFCVPRPEEEDSEE